MKSLLLTLMERDGLSKQDAQDQIDEARAELNDRLADGDDPYEICQEFFGLEPDYLMDLID